VACNMPWMNDLNVGICTAKIGKRKVGCVMCIKNNMHACGGVWLRENDSGQRSTTQCNYLNCVLYS